MEKEKRYKILNSLPVYGPMYVPVTANSIPFYSEGFPVRFYKTNGTDWVANFEPGCTGLNEIFEFEHTQNLLIVACGTCYLMDPDETNPIKVFGGGYSHTFKASEKLVLQNSTNLTIVEPDGKHWDTERISWDGLADIHIEDHIAHGLSFDPTHEADEWVAFSYDLNTKILTGGSYHRHDNRKPWWKIW
jgi:hypothetical protein